MECFSPGSFSFCCYGHRSARQGDAVLRKCRCKETKEKIRFFGRRQPVQVRRLYKSRLRPLAAAQCVTDLCVDPFSSSVSVASSISATSVPWSIFKKKIKLVQFEREKNEENVQNSDAVLGGPERGPGAETGRGQWKLSQIRRHFRDDDRLRVHLTWPDPGHTTWQSQTVRLHRHVPSQRLVPRPQLRDRPLRPVQDQRHRRTGSVQLHNFHVLARHTSSNVTKVVAVSDDTPDVHVQTFLCRFVSSTPDPLSKMNLNWTTYYLGLEIIH